MTQEEFCEHNINLLRKAGMKRGDHARGAGFTVAALIDVGLLRFDNTQEFGEEIEDAMHESLWKGISRGSIDGVIDQLKADGFQIVMTGPHSWRK